MSGKQNKRLRKAVRREVRKRWRADLDFLQSLPLKDRIRIAFQIVTRIG